MKNFIILFLLFYINIIIVNAQWESCNNGITDYDVIKCFAIDGNNTYAGIHGGMFITTNYGNNWITKNNGLVSKAKLDIESLAINENNIFAGTLFDGLFFSSNKGENWVPKNNGLSWVRNDFDTLYPVIKALKIVGNNVYAGTEYGIYITTDNGNNWIPKSNGLPQKYDSIINETFINIESLTNIENNIFAGTWHGVYITTDNGENWSPKNKGMENLIILSLATSGNNIFAGTEFGGIFLSTDFGDNWENIGFEGYSITTIITLGNNIIVGGYGVNLTTDNGNNWTPKNSGLTHLGVISMIINGDYIFVGIDNYGIFRAKLSDLGITDVKETEQTNGIKIFPNPASDKIKIKLKDEFTKPRELHILNSYGQEIIKTNESASDFRLMTNDSRQLELDVSTLFNGVYFAVLELNGKHYSKPFVVQR